MMDLRFPLSDVKIEITGEKQFVDTPGYTEYGTRVNQHEFSLAIDSVAHYFARNGNFIQISPYQNASKHNIELYLNGSVYGAILHQRNILPLHGSGFLYRDQGMMVCGDSGVGKSSITTSFCMNGALFLTDDVSPVIFDKGRPMIWAISDRIKLWQDSLEQLKLPQKDLIQIQQDMMKYYFPVLTKCPEKVQLHQLFVLHIHEKPDFEFYEVNGVDKFVELRKQVYREEYLKGMPETEAQYLEKLIHISKSVRIVKVFRPQNIEIKETRTFLTEIAIKEIV
jgi:hypothetical protein